MLRAGTAVTLAPRPFSIFCAGLFLCIWQPRGQYPADKDVLKVAWFCEVMAQCLNLNVATKNMRGRFRCLSASVALHTAVLVNGGALLVTVITLSWFLLKIGNSPPLLAEGVLRKPLACICPRMDCQCCLCFMLLVQPLSFRF